MSAQTQLNAIAAKLASLKARKDAMAALEAELKAEALQILEDNGVTTVDCPKGKFQIREIKTFVFTPQDQELLDEAKADFKKVEAFVRKNAKCVLQDPTLAFTAAKKIVEA